MLILENTLYTNQQEKDNFLSQPDQVMDALIVNYFGFLGLFKLGSKRGTLKNYPNEELSVRVTSITDDNQDPSLVVKLAYEAGMLRLDVVNQMTRLLSALKQGKIQNGKDLDETKIRELASLIQINTHKPSPVILQIFKSFVSGDISLGQLSRDLYQVTKKKELKKVSKWFREKVQSGVFLPIFAKISPSITTSQPVAATSTTTPSSDTLQKDWSGFGHPYPMERKLNDQILTDAIIRGNYDSIGSIKEVTSSDIEFAEKWIENNFAAVPFDIKKILDEGVNNVLHKELSKISEELADRVATGFIALQYSHWLSDMASKPEVLSSELKRISDFGKKAFDISFTLSKTKSEIWKNVSKKNSDSKEMIKMSFWRDFEAMLNRSADLPVHVFNSLEQNSLIDHRRDDITNSLDRQSLFLLGGVKKVWTNLFPPNKFHEVIKNTFGVSLIAADLLPGNTFEISIDNSKIDEKLKSLLSILEKYPSLKTMFKVMDQSLIGGDPLSTAEFIRTIRDGIKKNTLMSTRDLDNALSKIDISKVSIPELKNFIKDEQKRTPSISNLNISLFNMFNREFYSAGFTDLLLSVYDEVISEGLFPLEELTTYYYRWSEWSEKITPSIDKFVEKNFDEILKQDESTIRFFTFIYNGQHKKEEFFAKWGSEILEALKNKITIRKDLHLYRFYMTILKMKNRGLFKDKIWIDNFNIYNQVLTLAKKISKIDLRKEFIEMELSEELKNQIVEVYESSPKSNIYAITPNIGEVSSSMGIVYGFLPEEITTSKILERFTERLEYMKPGVRWKGIDREAFKYNKILLEEYNSFLRKISDDKEFKTANPFDVIFSALEDPKSSADPKKVLEEIDFKDTVIMTNGSFNRINNLVGKLNNLIQKRPDIITDKALSNLLRAISTEDIKFNGEAESAFEELRDIIITQYLKVIDENPDLGDKLFEELGESGKKTVSNKIKSISFLIKSLDVILHDDCPIKPMMKLDIRDMGDILKKNRVKVGKDRLKKGEKISEFKQRLDDKVPIEPLHVKEIPISDEELQRKSAEYDALNNGKHGAIGVRILKEFDVNLPIQEEGQREFEAKYPNSEIHERQFHGCGSIAASFILRYGYAIFKEGDSSAVKTAGKMLRVDKRYLRKKKSG